MGQSLKKLRNRIGFSLLEVLLVLGLMALLLITLFGLLTRSLLSMSHSEQSQQAMSIAREQIEQIKSRRVPFQLGQFDGRAADAKVSGFPPAPYPGKIQGASYTILVDSRALSDRLLHLRVEVQGQDGIKREVTTVLTR